MDQFPQNLLNGVDCILTISPGEFMSESAQEVLHELTSAGLLSSDHVTSYSADIETGTEALLKRLIEDKRITEFQAQKFRDGKASDIYFGDYVVIDKLGQGGMGTVLLARHRRMDRQVAIKILPITALESKDAVARFYQEVKVAAQLTHPNIVVAYDAGEHHGFQYLVMEYVPGHDLAEVLSQLGPIPIPMALDYINQAAKGLEYAHRKGIIHRDIKPSNLLLNDEGDIKILDMGLARVGSNSINQEMTQLTTTGQVMGTVEYMSPEQAEDTRQADERSDIYSLGCTFYRLLTGQSPFSRDTVVKTILAHRSDSIPPIETGLPEDEAVNRLFRKMVAKKPEDRFQSVTMLVDAIRRIEEGEDDLETSSHPPSFGDQRPSEKTAIVQRFETQENVANELPEAIIPAVAVNRSEFVKPAPAKNEPPVEYISDDAIVHVSRPNVAAPRDPAIQVVGQTNPGRSRNVARSSETQPKTSQSEIIYIPDIAPPKGRVKRIRKWIKDSRSNHVFIWSVMAVGTCWLPFVGLIIGWLTWSSANQDIHDIKRGRRDPRGYWATRMGKFLAIGASLAGAVATFLAIIGVHPMV